MKKLSFLLLSFFVSAVAAQDYVPTEKDVKHFYETKTAIVLEDNQMAEYNLIMKEEAPAEWTITPFEFMSWKNYEKKTADKAYSFVTLNKVTIEKDKSNALYLFLNLVLGGPSKGLSDMPDLCSIPIAYFRAEEETYLYKISVFLRFMQNHVKLISQNPAILEKNILMYYNKNVQKLDGKTLYLLADELAKDVNTEAKIQKVYNGPVKIATVEEIKQAIANKDPNVVFLHKVGPGDRQKNARCYKMLVGVADAQFYYFDYHTIDSKSPDAFMASDFKKLSRKN
ncbi:hypothetical protein FACS189430_00150 [Bacteroidia bacterium]|nr:hypothetical protein FACS189430_00150 [Bacteroidia bacterium]